MPRLPVILFALCALAAVRVAAADPLKLGVPAGTYGPDLDAQPQPPKRRDDPPPKAKPGDDPDAKEIDGVTVKGKRSAAGKLPTLGTDKPRERDVIDKLTDWYGSLEKDPDKLTPDEKAFLERTSKDSDPNHRGPAVTPPSRESTDYADPIESAKKSLKKP